VYDLDVDVTGKFIASVAGDRRLNIYSCGTGKMLRSYKPDPSDFGSGELADNGGGSFIKVSLDPSGLYAVTASSDKIIRVFDFYTGACVARMVGHGELITSVRFSPDGSRIISTGGDGCIFIWKIDSGIHAAIRVRMGQLGTISPDISMHEEDAVDHESHVFSNEMKENALRDAQASSGFVFRYSESGLPSWARSGYDPAKSLSAGGGGGSSVLDGGKKGTKPPIPATGKWAEVYV
jgi:WD40 repeat protein